MTDAREEKHKNTTYTLGDWSFERRVQHIDGWVLYDE